MPRTARWIWTVPCSGETALGGRLVELTGSLRQHGIRVGTSEVADAGLIAAALGLDDRIRLRTGLAAAMVRRSGDREIFDRLFDLYFPAAPGRRTTRAALSVDELREALVQAVATGDVRALEDLAAGSVDLLGQIASDDARQGYSAAQTISRLQPQRVIAAAQQQSRSRLLPRSGAGEQLSDRFDREEMRSRVAVFRRQVQAEALRRNTAVRPRERVARFGVGTGVQQRDFLSADGADLPGSVGAFSTFTMLLMQALHAQFRRVRAYGFVSSTAEITDLLSATRSTGTIDDWARRTGEFTAHGTSSSYGAALRGFVDSDLEIVGARSTVLILGDARTNHGDPGVQHLAAIRDRARHVAWLNPEPARLWDTGDSAAAAYGLIVDMHECRNLDQLRAFVGRVLPL